MNQHSTTKKAVNAVMQSIRHFHGHLEIDADARTMEIYCGGTGIRYRTALSEVRAKIGGEEVSISYAGEQGGYVGLDQVNLLLPRSLAGRGEVDVTLIVDGKPANTVKVQIK